MARQVENSGTAGGGHDFYMLREYATLFLPPLVLKLL
jgi:hypothetical protein